MPFVVIASVLCPSASAAATISGTVSYTGPQTGDIWVVACVESNSWATNYSARISETGAYSIVNVTAPSNYYIRAWRDSGGNASNDLWEARGDYTDNPVAVSGDTNGINVSLSNPDSDADGLADYDEIFVRGTNPNSTDSDGDGWSNYQEWQARTSPTNGSSQPDFLGLAGTTAAVFQVGFTPSNFVIDAGATNNRLFYRIKAERP